MLGSGGHREWLLGKTLQMVRHTRRHHLARVGQEGLRCGLRIWGDLWVALRRPRHGALCHLRVLLRHVALGRLVASQHLGLMLGLMHLTWIYLLVLWGNTWLGRQIPVRWSLLGAGNSPGSRLVPLRQLLAGGLRELLRWRLLLLLLRRLGYRSWTRNMDRDSRLRHVMGETPHLRDVAG